MKKKNKQSCCLTVFLDASVKSQIMFKFYTEWPGVPQYEMLNSFLKKKKSIAL